MKGELFRLFAGRGQLSPQSTRRREGPSDGTRRLDAVTGPFAYVRLLGDREAVDALTATLDHVVIDRGGQVAEDAEAIWLLRQRVPVVTFVNNHFAGYAPETVRQLVALMDAVASA
jgi:hypothetical protein